jgi:hypothetical protein
MGSRVAGIASSNRRATGRSHPKEAVGFSSERFKWVDEALQRTIDQGDLAGVVPF